MHSNKDLASAVGNTPIIQLNLGPEFNAPAHLRFFAKLEHLNPSGSHKDRLANALINQLSATQQLQSDSTIILHTTGNLGISIATLFANRNYKLVCLIPERTSQDRIQLLKAL